jgi:hypothetical protein
MHSLEIVTLNFYFHCTDGCLDVDHCSSFVVIFVEKNKISYYLNIYRYLSAAVTYHGQHKISLCSTCMRPGFFLWGGGKIFAYKLMFKLFKNIFIDHSGVCKRE